MNTEQFFFSSKIRQSIQLTRKIDVYVSFEFEEIRRKKKEKKSTTL